jgi:hypothetical protein
LSAFCTWLFSMAGAIEFDLIYLLRLLFDCKSSRIHLVLLYSLFQTLMPVLLIVLWYIDSKYLLRMHSIVLFAVLNKSWIRI